MFEKLWFEKLSTFLVKNIKILVTTIKNLMKIFNEMKNKKIYPIDKQLCFIIGLLR